MASGYFALRTQGVCRNTRLAKILYRNWVEKGSAPREWKRLTVMPILMKGNRKNARLQMDPNNNHGQ